MPRTNLPAADETVYGGGEGREFVGFRPSRAGDWCGAVGAWLSIAAGAALFAIAHANTGHWPALFILGVCLGYAYEKSGSLLRPIFIHSIFNATMVVSALYA